MDNQDSPLFFGDWLKRRRKSLDLTQVELAQRAGCSVFALRKIESGERRPSKQLAGLLARSLQLSPEESDAFTSAARGALPAERLAASAACCGRAQAAAAAPQAHSIDSLAASLPPLLGREPELAALGRLLRDPSCRLVTLIGPGGIGKTRLAVEACSRHHSLFANGAYFVSLASIHSSAFLLPALAEALGVASQSGAAPRALLLAHLRGKRALLALDNFEHLLDSAGLLADILEQAPGVKLLVTSRERLSLQSEWVFVLQGLPVPPADQVEHALEYTSVQLFVQSARRASVAFELRAGAYAAVVDICRMVEGMPLGIELAAAWVSVLDCRQIAQEIERSLDFLATSIRDVPDRQRSLRAVFDHSWSLLTPQERGVLGRLATFRGGFRRDAAEQVVGATLLSLYALTSKSLLRHSETGRYDLHEVVRQYALARFVADPACEPTRAEHSRFYLSLLRDREAALKGAAQREAIRELKDEIDNLRAAWAWAIDHRAYALIGPALRSFGLLCSVGVLYSEGIEQIEQIVEALRSESIGLEQQTVLGMALAQLGMLYFRSGQFGRATSLYEESLATLRPLGNPALLTDPLVISGVIRHLDGELDRAQALMEEGLSCARSADDRSMTAYARFNLGYIAALRGHYVEGYEQMQEGLALWRELGDPSAIALGLNHITPTAIQLGRLDEAETFMEESLSLLTQVGDRWGMGTAYRLLGRVALAQGDGCAAQAHIRRSLDIFKGYIVGWDIAQSLIYLGEAAWVTGDPAEARRILLEALHAAQEARATPLMLDVFSRLAVLQAQSGEREEALRLACAVLGHPASVHEAKSRAAAVEAAATAQLATDQLLAAKRWAAERSLESITGALLAP